MKMLAIHLLKSHLIFYYISKKDENASHPFLDIAHRVRVDPTQTEKNFNLLKIF